MLTKARKRKILDDVGEIFSSNSIFIVVGIGSVSVPNILSLRKSLNSSKARLKSVKNTLATIAAKQNGAESLSELFGGSAAAIVYGSEDSDIISVTKSLFAFIKENKDEVNVLGGMFHGRFLSSEEVERISSMPSIEQAYGILTGVLCAPMESLLHAFATPMCEVVRMLDKYAKSIDN